MVVRRDRSAGAWRGRVDALLDKWDDRIRGKPGVEDDPSDVAHTHITVKGLLRAAGRKARSEEFDDYFAEGLEQRRLFSHPALRGSLPRDKYLRITRDPVPEPVYGFAEEPHLRDFLVRYWQAVPELRTLKLIGAEQPLRSTGKRMDLLFLDPADDSYLVVELKVDAPGLAALSQLLAYMKDLRVEKADKEGRKVKGLLITGDVNPALVTTLAALAKADEVRWIRYELDIRTQEVLPDTE